MMLQWCTQVLQIQVQGGMQWMERRSMRAGKSFVLCRSIQRLASSGRALRGRQHHWRLGCPRPRSSVGDGGMRKKRLAAAQALATEPAKAVCWYPRRGLAGGASAAKAV